MNQAIAGIHHITGICGPAEDNYDFFVQILGLRFVKKTVNFDDPGTYHLYYANETGEPGSVITFFPWENAYPGRAGVGSVTHTAFSIPAGSVDYWMDRFTASDTVFRGPLQRMDEEVVAFEAPDGLLLELVGVDGAAGRPAWGRGSVPEEHAIRGFHSATLGVPDFGFLERFFTEVFGWAPAAEEEHRHRFAARGDSIGQFVDLAGGPDLQHAVQGTGTIHHIAFRCKDADEQLEWREKVLSAGLRVTEVRDRCYFKSIYFREPGGILFEIATDGPGFDVDEPIEELGTSLKLPPWLEERRAEIEERLVEL